MSQKKTALPQTSNRDFRSFLQQELVRRTQQNPRYSLRSFARFLEVQPPFLSNLLSGRRRITKASIRRFGTKLGLQEQEMKHFELNIDSSSASHESFETIAYEHFQMISEWYHLAILELSLVDHFQGDPKWISQTLGITLIEAKLAIQRLLHLGYIEQDADGKWHLLKVRNTTLGSETTAEALRKMQRQILEKAIIALDEVAPEYRDQSAMTMATNPEKIAEAKKRIQKFRRELCVFLETTEEKNTVYHLSLSLYPVSQLPHARSSI